MIPRFVLPLSVLLATAAPTLAAELPATTDPEIAGLVHAVSATRLETTIRTLAGFGTRHSLSATDDPKRGIGAARRWIKNTLDACAAAPGARLKVEFDEFVEEPSPRVPKPATLVNVVATLEGVDPLAKARTLVVSGHYDSMCGNVMNSECDAPGANDDASGTAVVMELACVFAKSRFPATLVFMAVAGEEQGLLGAAHWAKTAHDRGVNVEAMITNDIVGNAHDETGRRDATILRLFAEGVPADKQVSEEWQQRLATGGENDSAARELARTIRDAAMRYVPEMTVKVVYRRDRYLRGGDHIPFLAQGFTAVRFTEAHEDFRHQHQDVRMVDGVQFGDLPQFVDFEYLSRVARVNAAALASLATRTVRAGGRTYRDDAAGKPDDDVLARQSRTGRRRLRDRLARDHRPILAGRRIRRQRHPRQRTDVQGRLPVLGSRRRGRRPAQPGHLSADAAQPAGAATTGEVEPAAPGAAIPWYFHARTRAFHPAQRVFVALGEDFVACTLRRPPSLPRMRSNGPAPGGTGAEKPVNPKRPDAASNQYQHTTHKENTMNSYQPSTPRTAFGVLAFALTLVTFSLSVVAPVALVAQADTGAGTPTVTAGTITRLQS